MNEMSEKAISILHLVCNNSPITKSTLSRRTTTELEMFADERNEILSQLVELGLVRQHVPLITIGRRPPTYYYITDKGRKVRDQILEDERSLGAC